MRLISAGRKPPIIHLSSSEISKEKASFYVDTGADISVIKESKISKNLRINKSEILAIVGVTPGESLTLGKFIIVLHNIECEMHIVPDSFPIDTDGLIGWDILSKCNGQIHASDRYLLLNGKTIPFISDEKFTIPARHKQIICARVKNINVNADWVPLQKQ